MSIIPFLSSSSEFKWLSNFHQSNINVWGKNFPTVENGYVYSKLLTLGATELIAENSINLHPAAAKNAGACFEAAATLNQLEEWTRKKILIMEILLRAKFALPEFKAKLLATGEDILVEAGPDKFWGAGCYEGKVRAGAWKGANILGKLIMSIRNEIRGSTRGSL